MTKTEILEQLNNLLEEAESNFHYDISNYFYNDNKDYYTNNSFICDSISECADNNVDIYNYDLLEWAKGNYSWIEEAIDNFGVAQDSNGRADFIRTIQSGQFMSNEHDIYNDIEEIIKAFVIYALIEELQDIEFTIDSEQFDLLKDALEEKPDIDTDSRFDDISDYVNELIKKYIKGE